MSEWCLGMCVIDGVWVNVGRVNGFLRNNTLCQHFYKLVHFHAKHLKKGMIKTYQLAIVAFYMCHYTPTKMQIQSCSEQGEIICVPTVI